MKLTRKEFLLLGILLYFTFIGGTFYSQLNFGLRLANQVIVTVILGGWLLGKVYRRQTLPATPLDGAIGLYLLAAGVSAWFGLVPRFSLELWWFTLTHTLAFYLLVDLSRRGWTARLTWAFYMASAVVCLVGLAEFLAWYVGTPLFPAFAQGWVDIGGWQQPIPPALYRLAITLNGSTPLSAYLALLTPPALGLMLSLPHRNPNRPVLAVWLVLAVLVQILTFSRAGVLALASSLSLTALGWYSLNGRRWSALGGFWRRLSRQVRTLVIAGGLILVVVILFWLQGSFANRVGSTQFRLVLWRVALTTFREYWLTGAGPGNFGRALLRLNQADLPRLQIGSAHNVYLNTAAELGLIGLLAGAYLVWRVGQAWWQRWRRAAPASAGERLRLITVGAALVGLMAQTVVDTYSATPNILVLLALVAYLVSDLPVVSAPLRRRWLTLGATVLLFGYAAGFIWLARADWHFQRSLRTEQAGNLVEAVNQAKQAQALDPTLTLYTFRLARLKAQQAAQTNDPGALQQAISHYQLGLQYEPIWGLHSANLAGLLWQHGQLAEAITTMQRTLTAENAPLYSLNLGYFLEQTGNWTEAANAYGQALAGQPDLAGSGFWQASPERAGYWPAVVDAAVKHVPAENKVAPTWLQVRLALSRGEFEAVETLIGPVPAATDPALRAALVEAYLSQGRVGQASALLHNRQPQTAQDYLLGGRLYWQTGDSTSAEQWLKTAVFLGEPAAYGYLGQLYEQRGDLRAAETAYTRAFSPHYVSENIEVTIYGRPGANDLGPQLLRVGVGARQAAPWLNLARLYESQDRYDEAKRIYEMLLLEDRFLTVSRERLDLLTAKMSD
jgi:tetratricopeptide (TPR) repeat protein